MNVYIKTIPHSEQRYDTCGDWWWEGSQLQIRVSSLGDTFYEQLIAFHEYAEALMCSKEGISEAEVTAYDERFEIMRAAFPDVISADSEPGNQRLAPYKKQHARATELEKSLCKYLGLDWNKYDKAVNNLGK